MVIAQTQDSDGRWSRNMEPFLLANSRSKKDNSQIIVGTFGVLMNNEMNTLKRIGPVLYFREGFEGSKLYVAL